MKELLTLSNLLPTKIQNQDEYDLLAEAALEAVSEQKVLKANPEISALKAKLANHTAAAKPWGELEESLRARIIEAKTNYEKALAEAYKDGGTPPAGFVDPKGVSWRKIKRWRKVGPLTDKYLTVVVNEAAVTEAIEAGMRVEGIEVYDEYVLALRSGE